ncbi:MAG TPA: hypothetical protein VGL81_25615 [Polyangiaceae bacterium]|jgi:hypothetical protein
MKNSRLTAMVVAGALPLFACSAAPESFGDQPADTEVAATVTPAAKSPCPTKAPRAGSACSDASLLCSWGSDPRFGCRTIESCDGSTWQSVGDSCSSREPSCPRSAPTPPDSGLDTCTAADLGLTCVYAHEAYTCAPCQGTLCRNENYWQTDSLPTGCPAAEPNFGASCIVPSGTRCNYNACASDGADDYGASMTCTGGFWTAYKGTICL